MRLLPLWCSRIGSWTALAAALAVVAGERPAAAEVTITEAPGRPPELRDGARRLGTAPLTTPPAERGPASVRTVQTTGRELVEVSAALRGGRGPEGRRERWVAERRGDRLVPVVAGVFGPQDADGEWRSELVVSAAGVERFDTLSRSFRCDGRPVKLRRRVWDFETRSFRAEPEAEPPAATVVRPEPGQAPTAPPLGTFSVSFASNARGVGEDPRELVAPSAVDDDDPSTAWVSGGGGLGDVLGARGAAAAYGVTGIKVRLPAEAGYGRPRRLELVLGKTPDERFTLEVPERAGARGPETFWWPLPRPVPTACASLVVSEVAAGEAARPLAIAEIDVYTELDGPGGVARLAQDAATGPGCHGRTSVLAGLGARALEPVAEALSGAQGAAQGCLLEVLAKLPVPQGAEQQSRLAERVADSLTGEVPGEDERLAADVLRRLPLAPMEPLVARLRDARRPAEDRTHLARALAAAGAGRPEARAALVATVGTVDDARSGVRTAIAAMDPPPVAELLEALAADGLDETRRADLLATLGLAVGRDPSRAAEVRAAATKALGEERAGYEVRARATQALAAAPGEASVEALDRVRATDGDPVLRYLAVRAMAEHQGERATRALRAALTDADPRVRETAALAAAKRGDRAAAGAIETAYARDAWPFARRAEITAVGTLCAQGAGDRLIAALEREVDHPPVRQAALEGLGRCRDPRAAERALRVLGRRAESAATRTVAARVLGDLRNRSTLGELGEALARLRSEVEADPSLEEVIAAAALAVGRIGGPEAVTTLTPLLEDRRAPVRQAAVGGLGVACDRARGAAALDRAAKDADPGVAATARAARRTCNEPATSRPPSDAPTP